MATRLEQNNFEVKIEELVKEKDVNYIEAIVLYCEETGLEIDLAGTLVNSNLKSKIKRNAQDLNLLPKSARLPI